MARRVDINCDMGESFGVYTLGLDEEVIRYITSANVACGFHAGDPNVMDRTVRMAKEQGVGVGAHPGFPDLRGFGRRPMDVAIPDLINDIIYQIGALEAFCRRHGVALQHIKSHGSMNNMADADRRIADAIIEASMAVWPEVPNMVKPGTHLHRAALDRGAPFVLEVFADRGYHRDLTLVSRKRPDAVIADPQMAAERAVRMVVEGKVTTVEGDDVDIQAETICVHGDTPGALEIVRAVRRALEAEGIEVAPLGAWWSR